MKLKDFFNKTSIRDFCRHKKIKSKLGIANIRKNNLFLKHKSNDRGRSMLEMLGVLGIIALLSIGGIIGFRYTMTSYQAGQIQDIIAQSKILVATTKKSFQKQH